MGGGGSSSSSASTTNNIDKRLVTGQNSVGISADSSSVSVQVLDGGAIAKAFDFARGVDANAGKNLTTVLNLAGGMFDKTAGALDKNFGRNIELAAGLFDKTAGALDKSAEIVAQAYDQAKGQGAEARVLAYGAMAVVALVAVKSFGK